MTNKELKAALISRNPVVYRSNRYGEIRYKRINAIIYKLDRENKILVSAELLDYNDNSITVARGSEVFIDNENEKSGIGKLNKSGGADK